MMVKHQFIELSRMIIFEPNTLLWGKENEKNKKIPLWHYPLLFIVGIVSMFVGIMLVRFIFSLFY